MMFNASLMPENQQNAMTARKVRISTAINKRRPQQ
jgi:hypothetical protein